MRKERIVEILILICIFAFLIAGVLIFRHYKFVKPNTYNIIFKDIDSIVKGSPVRFMGMNVGHVIKLRRKDKYILCKIRITKKGVKIPDSTRAKVEFNGLGGSKSIELMPPLDDNNESEGIIAYEALRINDIVNVAKDLKEVCIMINNFVQGIDPDAMIISFKEITNPKTIETIDDGLDHVIERQNKINKNARKVENPALEFLNSIDKSLKNFFKN